MSNLTLEADLQIVGLEDLIRKQGVLSLHEFKSPCYSETIPILIIQSLSDLGRTEKLESSRKACFQTDKAVIKTGELGMGPKDRLDDRKKAAFEEFALANEHSRSGLPAVRPVCIINDSSDNEHYIVEPKGLDLQSVIYDIVMHPHEFGREPELTVRALGRLFGKLREKNADYIPNIKGRRGIFEHMIRFKRDDGYEILITDNPFFTKPNDNYNVNGAQAKVLEKLNKMTAGNDSLKQKLWKEYILGYFT